MATLRAFPSRFVLALALGACGGSTTSVPLSGTPLPADLTFTGANGSPVPLSTYLRPKEDPRSLLVIRLQTPWCGPCQWQRGHSGELAKLSPAGRVRLLDLLLTGLDNGPPTATDVVDWQARGDLPVDTVADPGLQLASHFPARAALPLILIVDTRTRIPLATLSSPTADELAEAIHTALARIEGRPIPTTPDAPTLVDDRFTRDQWDMVTGMILPPSASRDPTNTREGDPSAIALGKDLFFDADLSPSPKQVSCGSCHAPDLLFQDGKDQAPEGVGLGARNVPTVVLAPEQRSQFWDGRADSAWGQAIMPIEDPNEMASTRLFVAHTVARKYPDRYAALFGPLPPLADGARFPAAGKPGDAAWDGLAAGDKIAINTVFANVGKAMAAYEKSLWPKANRFDRYASGETQALTEREKDGLSAFFQAGCIQCHNGPRLTDDSFHALRFPTGRHDRTPDPGRLEAIPKLLANEFLRSSVYSDAPTQVAPASQGPALVGAFKTPGLRGVGYTLPYGHGGSFGGLASTIEAHRNAGLPKDSPYAVGVAEPWLVDFDPALIPKIGDFLLALTMDLPP